MLTNCKCYKYVLFEKIKQFKSFLVNGLFSWQQNLMSLYTENVNKHFLHT